MSRPPPHWMRMPHAEFAASARRRGERLRCAHLTTLLSRSLPLMPVLFFVCVIDILGFGILIPLVPYMADRFGVTPGAHHPDSRHLFALPAHCGAAVGSIERPLRPPSHPHLESCGACVSYLLLGFAHNVAGLVVARALAGVMAGNIAAAFAYASDISTPANRAKSMGTVGAAIGIGFMLGPAIGGLLAGDDIRSANFLRPAERLRCIESGRHGARFLRAARKPRAGAARRARRRATRRSTGAPLARVQRCAQSLQHHSSSPARRRYLNRSSRSGPAQIRFRPAHGGPGAVLARHHRRGRSGRPGARAGAALR
jgi:hypothetical protein